MVAFIYRDDMIYTEEEWEREPAHAGRPYPRRIAEIIVAKHRNGPLDTLNLYFREVCSRFENLATQEAA